MSQFIPYFKLTFLSILISYQSCLIAQNSPDDSCAPPQYLIAYDFAYDNFILLEWYPPYFADTLLQYDDGVNMEGIGGPSSFYYAAQWTPNQLYESVVDIVRYYPTDTITSISLMIWQGENAETLVYEEEISDIILDEWNEIQLSNPYEINPDEPLKVGFFIISPGYAAGCGNYTGNPNSDLISLDGNLWENLSDYGLDYCWNLSVHLNTSILNSPLGYNVYKNESLLNNSLILDLYFIDWNPITMDCYTVTAVYEDCGESDHSNLACVEFWGLEELNLKIKIYPNPTHDYCKIESDEVLESIKIFDHFGHLCYEENELRSYEENELRSSEKLLNLKNFAAGLYVLEIKSNDNVQKTKLIIQD